MIDVMEDKKNGKIQKKKSNILYHHNDQLCEYDMIDISHDMIKVVCFCLFIV